jgi:hypothetical protein
VPGIAAIRSSSSRARDERTRRVVAELADRVEVPSFSGPLPGILDAGPYLNQTGTRHA